MDQTALAPAPPPALPAPPYPSIGDHALIGDCRSAARVSRYRAHDGLRGDEGVFLPCSFWLADAQSEADEHDERAERHRGDTP